jgi:hypothetical protein
VKWMSATHTVYVRRILDVIWLSCCGLVPGGGRWGAVLVGLLVSIRLLADWRRSESRHLLEGQLGGAARV